MHKESMTIRSLYKIIYLVGVVLAFIVGVLVWNHFKTPTENQLQLLFSENEELFKKYNSLFQNNPQLMELSIVKTMGKSMLSSSIDGEPVKKVLTTAMQRSYTERELFTYHNYKSETLLLLSGESLYHEQVKIQDDLARMRVEKITRTFCRGNGCQPHNEILFLIYNFGFQKGISFNLNSSDIHLVDDLSQYGTSKDPRIEMEKQPKYVYKRIKDSWYVFGG